MPFNQKPQKFNAKINAVTIGSGDKTVTIGGENSFPFYTFDAPTENTAKIGVEISDLGLDEFSEGVKAYYEGATTMAEIAQKAAAIEGADFVALILDGGDPNGANKSVEELIEVVKEVAAAIDCPLVVEGCKNVEKDAELLPKVAEVLQGRNALLLSEKEENYKAIGAAAGLAYNQIVGAESAVDINLAKQLNVVTTQLGVDAKKIVMNIGSAAAGYGYEYVVSTMDRIKGAALGQNDNMLQMPIITPVSAETWAVKEATASEADMPEWGSADERGIDMEVMTAAADLAAGSDAVILKHPVSVATVSKLIKELSDDYLTVPEGSLYPALYKLIEKGYISDYKKPAGKRMIRVYYHLESSGEERLAYLKNEFYETNRSIEKILDYDFPVES